MLNRRHIRRRFERTARCFDDADFVHAKTRDGLLARLEPLTIAAETIVDLGAATGTAQRALGKRFGRARIVNVDLAHAMLVHARQKKSWLSRASFIQADAEALPFADQSIDIVFSNMLLPWVHDPTRVLGEVARVLRKEGLFAFATLGPDSLREIADAWRQVDDRHHVNVFPDMHDLGDGLVRAGLRDPVLDVDRLSISYPDCDRLLADLTATGARNALSSRNPGLTGRGKFSAMKTALEANTDDKLEFKLELVYGHCWGSGAARDVADYRIDAARIPVRGR